MILGDVRVPGKHLQCDLCKWRWISTASELPENCPNRDCRSREWNGKKKRTRKPKVVIELPKPKRVKWVEEETDF
jgi:hypothetical protein